MAQKMKLLYKSRNGIILIATDNSKNPKTGPMVQTWILDSVTNPFKAYKQGYDSVVCGDCKRKSKRAGGDGSCYVNTAFAPSAIWKKYDKDRNELTATIPYILDLYMFGQHKHIRIGAYGEPTLIPFAVWDCYLQIAKSWTGYTHQWRTCDQRFKKYCMASVDNVDEAREAQSNGWRTFRVDRNKHTLSSVYRHQLKEAVCPASKEAGQKVQCITCPDSIKCNGIGMDKKYNIVIKEH